MLNICVLDGHAVNPGDLNWDPLNRLGRLKVFDRIGNVEILTELRDVDVIITNKMPVGREFMDMFTRLRFISLLSTGYDGIVDVDYARQLGLPVANIPAYSGSSVAQAVCASMLYYSNRIHEYNDSVKRGDWEAALDYTYVLSVPVELADKTLGIVGYGDIGSRVARIAMSLGMRVVIAQKSDGSYPQRINSMLSADQNSNNSDGIEPEVLDLREVFQQSDFVSLNVPLNSETKRMINAEILSYSRPGLVLINTARGGLVHAGDLIRALDSSQISCYISDVHDPEPPRESAIIAHPKTVFTPHIAWASTEARRRAIAMTAANIEAWLDGRPINIVNGVGNGH